MGAVESKFQSADGREILLRPISSFLLNKVKLDLEAEWRARGEPLDPPTFTMTTVTGEIETLPYALETATQDGPETLALWNAHVEATSALNQAVFMAWTRICLFDGLIEPKDYQDERWAKRQAFMGVTVPTDPNERWWHYITTVLLSEVEDQAEATMRIMGLSGRGGMSEEDVAAAVSAFRHQVRVNQDNAGARAKQATAKKGQVDARAPDARSARSKGLGNGTKRLPSAKR